ncbi:tetratricopeptide repeat protein [Lysobacter sp. 5GHs7-4]|uniref:serine/threonine-protein kinase n=1 Tax=Lysobacter sp. 5GHs7-4 TaxID=2904253 RepID=UPI001E4E9204|nr:serine/threonine-protein kinase [Lysobacter sp. 5GHs7-4]UHQ22113.1 tetratricopeptide repeat protein [Lysobacter sp. 5GHs7-4]
MTDPSAATATGLYAQQRLAPGTLLAGRFRIEAVLGVGGMGVVYRATDLTLDVPVALKLLRPELATRADAFERFRQELLMARQVSSPRVVRIHDLAQHDGQWLIGMDYIDGESLDRKLDREGPLPIDDAVRIAQQIAQGLSAAHARGVIHRDLKPANVLIDRAGDAYITDFGVARSLASTGLTQSGAVVGTPDYLSPEQARGDTVDARSDLYALGLILYEMLAGALPFAGGTVHEVLAQRMLRAPAPVTKQRPQTPAWLARLTDRLLRPQPAHRLRSADEVVRALELRKLARDYRPRRGAWLTLAAMLALLSAGGAWWWWRAQTPPVPEGVAAVAPLHRLLVLPVYAPDDADLMPAHRAALAAQLRGALSGAPGLAVVDEDRTQQALRQLDPTGTAILDPAALRRTVGADRVLHVALRREGAHWLAHAELDDERGVAHRSAGKGATPLAAFAALPADAGFRRDLGLSAPLPLHLPAESVLEAYGEGLRARQDSAPVEALAAFRKAVDQAPEFAPAWWGAAEAAQAIGDIDAAYDAIERGQRVTAGAPATLRRRFVAERALLDGDAEAAAREWRAQLQATPDDTRAELELARALGAGGDLAGAVKQLQTLTARDANDPRAWYELGKFSILHGQARRAVDDYLVRALVLYKRSGNRYGEAETVNALGIGYSRLGQNDHAQEQYRKAVELRGAVGNRRGLATSLRNLGNVLSLSGRYDEAAASLEQARKLHLALDDRHGLAAVDSELGLLAEERGDYPAALAAFKLALQGWQQTGDDQGTAQALNDIGFAHYQLGAYDDAQAYLSQSAGAYDKLGDQTGRIRTSQNLGLLAVARGQWNAAEQRLQRALADAEREQMVEEAAVSRRNLAELALLQGRYDEALNQAGKAEALFRQRQDPRGIADAGLLRAQTLIAAGARPDAGKALDAIAASVAQAPAEQRGIDALLRAELARQGGDGKAAAQHLAAARRYADASGVRLLRLQVGLEAIKAGAGAATIGAEVAALGNVALRLDWAEAAIVQDLGARDAGAAVKRYREIQPLLRRGDYAGAFRLHELGAQALTQAGDAAAAARARDDAVAALQRVRERLPAPLRGGFDSAPQIARLDPVRKP